jgi:ribonuclease HI
VENSLWKRLWALRQTTELERGSTRSHCVENSLWKRLWALRQTTELERGSTRSHCVENSLWEMLWTCRKTDCMVMICFCDGDAVCTL